MLKKINYKHIISFLVVLTVIIIIYFAFFKLDTYDPGWTVGKSKEEIEEKYGNFDLYDCDLLGNFYGIYKGRRVPISCGLPRNTDTFTIKFDENNIAISAYKERREPLVYPDFVKRLGARILYFSYVVYDFLSWD